MVVAVTPDRDTYPMSSTFVGDTNILSSFDVERGNREDLLDVVTIISPVDTPLFTMFRKAKIHNVQTEWMVDKLDQAASNAVNEGSSAVFTANAARVRMSNYAQISREPVEVSDSQRAVNPAARSVGISDGSISSKAPPAAL